MSETELIIYRSIDERREAVELVEAGMVLVEKAGTYPAVLNDTDASVVSELRARLNGHLKRMNAERLEMTAGARAVEKAINDQFAERVKPMQDALLKIDASLLAHIKAKQDAERREREAREAEERRLREAEQRRLEEEARARRQAEIAAAQARESAARAEEAARKAAERGSAKAEAEAARARKAAEEAQRAAEAAETARLEREAQAAAAREAEAQRALALASAPVAADTRSIAGKFGSKSGVRDNWKYRVVDIAAVPENFLLPADERVQKAVLNALARSQKDKARVPGIEFYNEPILQSREAL